MVREWRYLKLLKRAGRGHIPGGVMNIKPGELCMRCPACPRPGFNLPTNWATVSDDMKYVHLQILWTVLIHLRRFIYTLIVAIDANFRLKRRAVSNNARDPGLLSGFGFFVPDQDYREYVLKYADQQDVSPLSLYGIMHGLTSYVDQYVHWLHSYGERQHQVQPRLCCHGCGARAMCPPWLHFAERHW